MQQFIGFQDLANYYAMRKGGTMGLDIYQDNTVTTCTWFSFLQECIRALGRKGAHLPFRGSKLTLVCGVKLIVMLLCWVFFVHKVCPVSVC